MNLKQKIYAENQKKVVEGKISVRRAFLKEKGLDNVAIQKDVAIRKMKAEIRKANYRLASIAAQEKLNAEKAQAKVEKLAARKSGHEAAPAKSVKNVHGKKGSKDKKRGEKKDKATRINTKSEDAHMPPDE
jgi:hypothetical protein